MNYTDYPRAVRAEELFKEGFNCAQAVFLAFNDLYDVDFDTAAKLSSPFGGGMGRLREVCGAVSGMFMALGAIYGYEDPKATTAKKELYATVQGFAAKFKDENGSIICREIFAEGATDTKPQATVRDEKFYKSRPCVEFVKTAAGILEEYINAN